MGVCLVHARAQTRVKKRGVTLDMVAGVFTRNACREKGYCSVGRGGGGRDWDCGMDERDMVK